MSWLRTGSPRPTAFARSTAAIPTASDRAERSARQALHGVDDLRGDLRRERAARGKAERRAAAAERRARALRRRLGRTRRALAHARQG